VIHIVGVACAVFVMYIAVFGIMASGRDFRKHYAAVKKQQEEDAEWSRRNWDKWMKRISDECEHDRQLAKDAAELSRQNAKALAFMRSSRTARHDRAG